MDHFEAAREVPIHTVNLDVDSLDVTCWWRDFFVELGVLTKWDRVFKDWDVPKTKTLPTNLNATPITTSYKNSNESYLNNNVEHSFLIFYHYINYKIFVVPLINPPIKIWFGQPHKIWGERDITRCIDTWYDIAHPSYITLSLCKHSWLSLLPLSRHLELVM